MNPDVHRDLGVHLTAETILILDSCFRRNDRRGQE
jgi:hypothetical protein